MPQRIVDNLFVVPLVHGLWASNEVVEANQVSPHPFDSFKLVLCLTPEEGHIPGRARLEVRDLLDQFQQFIKLLLCNENSTHVGHPPASP